MASRESPGACKVMKTQGAICRGNGFRLAGRPPAAASFEPMSLKTRTMMTCRGGPAPRAPGVGAAAHERCMLLKKNDVIRIRGGCGFFPRRLDAARTAICVASDKNAKPCIYNNLIATSAWNGVSAPRRPGEERQKDVGKTANEPRMSLKIKDRYTNLGTRPRRVCDRKVPISPAGTAPPRRPNAANPRRVPAGHPLRSAGPCAQSPRAEIGPAGHRIVGPSAHRLTRLPVLPISDSSLRE